jgi:hypothetical protein
VKFTPLVTACADCAAGFIIVRTAIIRYPKRRRTRTAKRAEFSPHRARIRCSTELTGWPDRTNDRHRAAKAKIGLQNLAYNIRRLVTLERMAAA